MTNATVCCGQWHCMAHRQEALSESNVTDQAAYQ